MTVKILNAKDLDRSNVKGFTSYLLNLTVNR